MVALLILSGLVYYIVYSLKILGLQIYRVWLLESVHDYNVWLKWPNTHSHHVLKVPK